jgi:hypothetical protein
MKMLIQPMQKAVRPIGTVLLSVNRLLLGNLLGDIFTE